MKQVNYNNQAKNKWRSDVWKILKQKIIDRDENPFDCKILYLPGSEALDIKEARRKGFDVNKMIAVEMDSDIAAKLRADGRFVIEGKLSEVVYHWDGVDIDIIIADYCGQWSIEQWMLMQGLLNHQFKTCYTLINCMAGRETGDANLVQQLRRYSAGNESFTRVFKSNHVAYYIQEHISATLASFEEVGYIAKGNSKEIWDVAMKYMFPFERYTGKKAPFDSVLFYNSIGLVMHMIVEIAGEGYYMPSYDDYKKIVKGQIFHELDLVTS